MASRVLAAAAAALLLAGVAAAPPVFTPVPTTAPASRDLSITPFNISMDCLGAGASPVLGGLKCLVFATVQYSGAFDTSALVSLQLDGYFTNGSYYVFSQTETLATFQASFSLASSTTVNWTVTLPPSFETVQLLATVVVDWPNEVAETREDNNIARRMLQSNGLPYIVFVEHDLIGTFPYGVDIINTIWVTLDKPLPPNAVLRLSVDYMMTTNVDAQTSVLYQEVHRGPRTFYEYQLNFGMGSVRPLGRDGAAVDYVQIPYAVQIVALASTPAYSSLSGGTPTAMAQAPGYVVHNVTGFFRYTNYRAIVNDFIALAPAVSGASGAFFVDGVPNVQRAAFVTANLVTKAVDPNQRSANFVLSGTIPSSLFAPLASAFADPTGTATWGVSGGVVASVLGGVYGAALNLGTLKWSYSSADATFRFVDFAGNVTFTAAGTSFNIPLTINVAGSNARAHVTQFTLTLAPPYIPLVAMGKSVSVTLADGIPATATLQYNTPKSTSLIPAGNAFTIPYIPSLPALAFITNGATQGVMSSLEIVDPDAAAFLTPPSSSTPLLYIRRRTLTFFLSGPDIAFADDASRLERLSAGHYWSSNKIGSFVNFTLNVGAGASNFLARIDYTLRWLSYNVTSHGFSAPLSSSPSLYVGYATAGALTASSSALPVAAPIANLTGTTSVLTLFQLNLAQPNVVTNPSGRESNVNYYGLLSMNARSVLAANRDFSAVLGAIEVGGIGTPQNHPDVDVVHLDLTDFPKNGVASRRELALGASLHAASRPGRQLQAGVVQPTTDEQQTYLANTDEVWPTLTVAEASDLSYGQLAHYWPSVTYVAPRKALIAVEARVGWVFPATNPARLQYRNATSFALSANMSHVRVFAQSQYVSRSAESLFWTVSNDTLATGMNVFNGFPAISSYYTVSSVTPGAPAAIGNATAVVWIRDFDGNTEFGTHWNDQRIMWSRMIQASDNLNATDFNRTTWSAPATVGGPGVAYATIEALSLSVDATFSFMTRVDPATRTAWLHVWKTSGSSAFAAVQISSDAPASQVQFVRDASGSGFTVAYVTANSVKFARGTVADNGVGAPTVSLGTITTFPAAVTTTVGVSVLSSCATPYGHALAWLTKAGLVVSEMEYAGTTATPFLDTVALVDDSANTVTQQSVASGSRPDYDWDLYLTRQKSLSIAYADTTARPNYGNLYATPSTGGFGAFYRNFGPHLIAFFQSADLSDQVYRSIRTYAALARVAVVNVTFPSYDTPGATFRVRIELKNFGAVRSPEMYARVFLGSSVAGLELGRTVIPPILANHTLFVEINAATPTVPGFFVFVDVRAPVSYGSAAVLAPSTWLGSPCNVYLDNVVLDSTSALNYVIVNAGPLFGTVTVTGMGGSTDQRYVSQWSNVSVALTPTATVDMLYTTQKQTVQAIYISALAGYAGAPSTSSVSWATSLGGGTPSWTFTVPRDVNPWDNVAVLHNVFAYRSAVTPDTLVAYPTYPFPSSNVTLFVAAVGVTNIGNVPWRVSGSLPATLGSANFALQAQSVFSTAVVASCDTASCGALGYWCTGAQVGVASTYVNPGETCYVYFADNAPNAAQTYSPYAVFEAFVTSGWTVGHGPDSSPFGVSALLMAPHVRPTPGASGYTTWTANTPGPQQYNGYAGHYAMWRSLVDPVGQPLVVLALGSPVQYEGDVKNISMFVATESGAACSNMCSESGAGGQDCAAYASQCFTASAPSTNANIKLMLWRPVPAANATIVHYGDYQLIATKDFSIPKAGLYTLQATPGSFNWHVLPGDIFGWSSPYDDAARVVYSADLTPTGATSGPGGVASSSSYYRYSYIEGRTRITDSNVTAQFISTADLLTFSAPRQYSFEVGVAPSSIYTGRINLAVDLQREIVLVSAQASAPSCPQAGARTCSIRPYLAYCQPLLLSGSLAGSGTRQLIQSFPFTDDGATLDTPLPTNCSFGARAGTTTVLSDPFAVVVSAYSSNTDEATFVAGYGAPMFGNSCQTVVLPLSTALAKWIRLVNQSNFCTPPVSAVQQLTPLSDTNYSLHIGIVSVSALYDIQNYRAGWWNAVPAAYKYSDARFTVAQVLGSIGQTWSLSQCPNQSPAAVFIGADQSSPKLHIAKASSLNVVATVQTTCSRQDTPVTITTSCNSAPVVSVAIVSNGLGVASSSSTIPYSPVPGAMRVALDASGTYDPNDDLLTLTWRVVSKPASSSVSDASAFTPALVTVAPNNCLKKMLNATRVWFTPDVGGVYVVQLDASDGCSISAYQTTITVACGTAPTAVVSHVQAVFNRARSNAGDPDVYFWSPDVLNPNYADPTSIQLRAFNSEFFINSAVSPSLDWKVSAASAGPAYHFSYEWSVASTANPAISLGFESAPWNPATSDGSGNYRVACLGSTSSPNVSSSVASVVNQTDLLYASQTLAASGSDRYRVLPTMIQTVPAGSALGGGSVGRFTSVSQVQSYITWSRNQTTSFNQTAPLYDFFVISDATSPTATLSLPSDIRCRGAVDIRLRVIDRCDPTQIAEFRTPVVTQCPPAPVAIASVTIAEIAMLPTDYRPSNPFPALLLQPGVQVPARNALAPGATGSTYWRWYPANALTTAAISPALYLSDVGGAGNFTPPAPGTYKFTLLVSDGCWRDFIANDTLTINAVCRAISLPAASSVSAPTGTLVTLSAVPTPTVTSVTGPFGSPITVGATSGIWEENPAGSNPRLSNRVFTVPQQTLNYSWAVTSAPNSSRYFASIGRLTPLAMLSNFSVLLDVGGTYTFTVAVSDTCNSAPVVSTYTVTATCNALVANAVAKFRVALSPSSPNNFEACEFDPLSNSFTAYWSGPILPNGLGGGFTNAHGILLDPVGSSIAGLPLSNPTAIADAGLIASWTANWTLVSQPTFSALGPVPYAFAAPTSTTFEPLVPGPYVYRFSVSDSCTSASSTLTVNAVCNPLQYNLTLNQWTPGGSVLPSQFSTPVPAGSGVVYYVPENGTFPAMQLNSRSVYTKQGPYVVTEAWNSSRWLNYTFGVRETPSSPTWINNPYQIPCVTNELSDPGFELGALSGCWTTYVPNGGVSATVSTSVFATGTQSAAVTIGTNKVGGIKQQWTIPAGATSSYLSFHYAYVCTTPGATPPTLIISTDGSPSGSATTLATVTLTAASSATWVSYQVSLAQVAGTTQSFIIAFSNPSTSSSSATLYVDTVTLYLAGGTTPPPSVPTLFYQPYRFQSAGPKTVRVTAWDGCMQQTQTIAVTASCRALTTQSTWVYPGLAPGAALPALEWSPVNISGTATGYGRWWTGDLYNLTVDIIEGAYAGSTGVSAGTLGFYVSTKGAYTDSLTLLDGSTTTTTFNPAWTWNSLSVAVTPTVPGIVALQGLTPIGGSAGAFCSGTNNVSTSAGSVGSLGVSGFSNTRRTVSFGFALDIPTTGGGAPAPWLNPTLPVATRFGGIIHSCPLQSSPASAYVTPVFAVSAITSAGYQQIIPASYTMSINCTTLGMALFGNPYRFAQNVVGSALVIGQVSSLSGVQASGSFISTSFRLPPSDLGYALHVQSASGSEGMFELTTSFTSYANGQAPINCATYGWSNLAGIQYVTPLPTTSNVSLPIGLRPTFSSPLNYAITVSDGCASSTTTVSVPVSCTAFVPSLSWLPSNAATLTVYATSGSSTDSWAAISVNYTATYPSGLQLVPTPPNARANSLDVYLYVATATGSFDPTALALEPYLNAEAVGTHNVLRFTPPRVGTYTIGAFGTDGCYDTFATPITVTALCPTLTATPWQYLSDPALGASASTPWQYNFVENGGATRNGNDIYPVAGLAVNLTQSGASTAPWTTMTGNSWYTVTVRQNGVTSAPADYSLQTQFSVGLTTLGVYNWAFTMYKVATWTITFTFYDNNCVSGNVVAGSYCGSTTTTFSLQSKCDNNGPPFTFTPPSLWLVVDSNAAANVTNGTGSIVYNYNTNQFAPINLFPPASITNVGGTPVFGSQPIKQAAIAFNVVNGVYGYNSSTWTVIQTTSGAYAPLTSALYGADAFFYLNLPAGVGSAGTGSAIALTYAVFDGCQTGTIPMPFVLFAICNRTLSNSAVAVPAATYWQGAANKFQTKSWDASAVQFFNETGGLITTAGAANAPLNTTWSLTSIPAASNISLSQRGASSVVAAAYSGGSIALDAPGAYTVTFYTTDGCQTLTTPLTLQAICPSIVPSAQAALANSSIDLVAPSFASTSQGSPLVVASTSLDGATVVLTAANSTTAPYPGRTIHPLSYAWSVVSQPAIPGVVDYWGVFPTLRVNLSATQVASPVVVVSLRIPGQYIFRVNVSDGCTSAATFVYVTVSCSPPGSSFNLRNAVSYFNADLSEGSQFRALSIYANLTNSAGCELEPLPIANRALVAWTASTPFPYSPLGVLSTSRSFSFNPNGRTLPWAPFYAIADPAVSSAASMAANSVTVTARGLDYCFTPSSYPVTISGACTPAALVQNTGIPTSGEWDPVNRWSKLQVAFKVVYSGIDGWETSLGLPQPSSANKFKIEWDLISAPSGSRLTPPSGCPVSYIRSTDPDGPVGMSQRQLCSQSPSGGVDVVYPVLTYLSVAPYTAYTAARGMAVRVEADVPGSYVIRARWTDGCAYNSTTFTLVADCPTLTPVVNVQPSTTLIIPVGAAASFSSVALDASPTTYSYSALTDDMLINPRFFITTAPAASRFNAFSASSVGGTPASLRTDVSGYNTSAQNGTYLFRLSTTYATSGWAATQVSTPPSPNNGAFSLELLGVDGMTTWFLPDVEGTYAGYLQVQDFCPTAYVTPGPGGQIVATRNLTTPFSLSVTCVGNFSGAFDVSGASRSVVANGSNWTPIRLIPAGSTVNAPVPGRYVRTFWNLTSAPSGHPWVPLDLSSNAADTLAVQFATMHVANLESPLYATFVPTVAGAYVFTLSVWDPRCPGSQTNQTITINVDCAAASSTALSATYYNSATFKQDNVVTVQLSIGSDVQAKYPRQPVRYSWRTYSTGFPTSLTPTIVNAGQATATSASANLSAGGIAGVVIAVIVGAILIVVVIVLIVRAANKGGRGAVAAGDAAGAGGGAEAAAAPVTAPSGPEAGV